MKFSKIVSLASWMVVLILLSSCSIEDPEIGKIGDFKFKEIKEKTLSFSVSIAITNPNWFGFKVKKSTVELTTTSNEVLGTVRLEKAIRIKGNTEETYELNLKAQLADGALLKLARMSTKSTIEFHVKGKVRGSAFGIPKSKKLDKTFPIDPAILRKIKLF